MLMAKAKRDAASRWNLYKQMAEMQYTKPEEDA